MRAGREVGGDGLTGPLSRLINTADQIEGHARATHVYGSGGSPRRDLRSDQVVVSPSITYARTDMCKAIGPTDRNT